MNIDDYINAYKTFRKVIELDSENEEAKINLDMLKLGLREGALGKVPSEMRKYLMKR